MDDKMVTDVKENLTAGDAASHMTTLMVDRSSIIASEVDVDSTDHDQKERRDLAAIQRRAAGGQDSSEGVIGGTKDVRRDYHHGSTRASNRVIRNASEPTNTTDHRHARPTGSSFHPAHQPPPLQPFPPPQGQTLPASSSPNIGEGGNSFAHHRSSPPSPKRAKLDCEGNSRSHARDPTRMRSTDSSNNSIDLSNHQAVEGGNPPAVGGGRRGPDSDPPSDPSSSSVDFFPNSPTSSSAVTRHHRLPSISNTSVSSRTTAGTGTTTTTTGTVLSTVTDGNDDDDGDTVDTSVSSHERKEDAKTIHYSGEHHHHRSRQLSRASSSPSPPPLPALTLPETRDYPVSLPLEVLILVADEVDNVVRMRMTWVCRGWRHHLIHEPRLWTQWKFPLHIYADKPEACFNKLQAFLARAAGTMPRSPTMSGRESSNRHSNHNHGRESSPIGSSTTDSIPSRSSSAAPSSSSNWTRRPRGIDLTFTWQLKSSYFQNPNALQDHLHGVNVLCDKLLRFLLLQIDSPRSPTPFSPRPSSASSASSQNSGRHGMDESNFRNCLVDHNLAIATIDVDLGTGPHEIAWNLCALFLKYFYKLSCCKGRQDGEAMMTALAESDEDPQALLLNSPATLPLPPPPAFILDFLPFKRITLPLPFEGVILDGRSLAFLVTITKELSFSGEGVLLEDEDPRNAHFYWEEQVVQVRGADGQVVNRVQKARKQKWNFHEGLLQMANICDSEWFNCSINPGQANQNFPGMPPPFDPTPLPLTSLRLSGLAIKSQFFLPGLVSHHAGNPDESNLLPHLQRIEFDTFQWEGKGWVTLIRASRKTLKEIKMVDFTNDEINPNTPGNPQDFMDWLKWVPLRKIRFGENDDTNEEENLANYAVEYIVQRYRPIPVVLERLETLSISGLTPPIWTCAANYDDEEEEMYEEEVEEDEDYYLDSDDDSFMDDSEFEDYEDDDEEWKKLKRRARPRVTRYRIRAPKFKFPTPEFLMPKLRVVNFWECNCVGNLRNLSEGAFGGLDCFGSDFGMLDGLETVAGCLGLLGRNLNIALALPEARAAPTAPFEASIDEAAITIPSNSSIHGDDDDQEKDSDFVGGHLRFARSTVSDFALLNFFNSGPATMSWVRVLELNETTCTDRLIGRLPEVCSGLKDLDVRNSQVTCRGVARVVERYRESSSGQRRLERVWIDEPKQGTWAVKSEWKVGGHWPGWGKGKGKVKKLVVPGKCIADFEETDGVVRAVTVEQKAGGGSGSAESKKSLTEEWASDIVEEDAFKYEVGKRPWEEADGFQWEWRAHDWLEWVGVLAVTELDEHLGVAVDPEWLGREKRRIIILNSGFANFPAEYERQIDACLYGDKAPTDRASWARHLTRSHKLGKLSESWKWYEGEIGLGLAKGNSPGDNSLIERIRVGMKQQPWV